MFYYTRINKGDDVYSDYISTISDCMTKEIKRLEIEKFAMNYNPNEPVKKTLAFGGSGLYVWVTIAEAKEKTGEILEKGNEFATDKQGNKYEWLEIIEASDELDFLQALEGSLNIIMPKV